MQNFVQFLGCDITQPNPLEILDNTLIVPLSYGTSPCNDSVMGVGVGRIGLVPFSTNLKYESQNI